MTITLNLPTELAIRIMEEARKHGLAVNDYAVRLLGLGLSV